LGALQAQSRPQQPRGSVPLQGHVTDALTGLPIQYANIAFLVLPDSSIIAGGVSDARGRFQVDVPYGRVLLRIDYIGYERLWKGPLPVFPGSSTAKDLGTFPLTPKALEGEAVEVLAEKPLMTQTMDKRIFHVDQSLNAEGQSATEVLQQVPSVDVDMDGSISLRGSSNVVVLIDGKPSGLTGMDRTALLDQIPASTMESIEVITNPSAKYDPDGMSGILNIVLKHNRLAGLTGTLSANYNPIYTQGASAQINYRSKSWNLTSLVSSRSRERVYSGDNQRFSTDGMDSTVLRQESEATRVFGGITGRVLVDYKVTPTQSISVGILPQRRTHSHTESVTNTNRWPGNQLETYLRESEEEEPGTNLDLTLGYLGKFSGDDHELKVDFTRSLQKGEASGSFTEQDLADSVDIAHWREQVTSDENSGGNTSLSVDYTRPLGETARLELGTKGIWRHIQSDFHSQSQFSAGGPWLEDSLLALAFEFDETIQAIYGTYGRDLDRFSYQLGLRLEDATTNASLSDSTESFRNTYTSLFPSLHIGYELTPFQDLSLSYSRRVNRPRHRALLPNINYSDPLNLRTGNPYLLPEYIDSYEVGYNHFQKGFGVSGALYWRNEQNLIQRYKEIDSTGVAITTFKNLGTAGSGGFELTLNGNYKKILRVMVSGNLTRTKLAPSVSAADLNSDFLGYMLRSTVSYSPVPGTSVEWFAFYRSPRDLAQGQISYMLFSNLSLRQSFLDKRATFGVQVSDLFNSRNFEYHLNTTGFIQDTQRRFNNRYLGVNLSYRFGSLKDAQRDNRRGTGRPNGDYDSGDDIDIGG